MFPFNGRVLQHGGDPATKRLAEEIIAGQTIEIEGLTRRLAALRQGNQTDDAKEFPALVTCQCADWQGACRASRTLFDAVALGMMSIWGPVA